MTPTFCRLKNLRPRLSFFGTFCRFFSTFFDPFFGFFGVFAVFEVFDKIDFFRVFRQNSSFLDPTFWSTFWHFFDHFFDHFFNTIYFCNFYLFMTNFCKTLLGFSSTFHFSCFNILSFFVIVINFSFFMTNIYKNIFVVVLDFLFSWQTFVKTFSWSTTFSFFMINIEIFFHRDRNIFIIVKLFLLTEFFFVATMLCFFSWFRLCRGFVVLRVPDFSSL